MRTYLVPALSAFGLAAVPISSGKCETAPHVLTTMELKNALTDSWVEEVVPEGVQDLSTPEEFHRNGTYVRHVDNRDIEGRYTLERGLVCVVDELRDPEYCRYVLVDGRGQFYFGSTGSARLLPIKILPRRGPHITRPR